MALQYVRLAGRDGWLCEYSGICRNPWHCGEFNQQIWIQDDILWLWYIIIIHLWAKPDEPTTMGMIRQPNKSQWKAEFGGSMPLIPGMFWGNWSVFVGMIIVGLILTIVSPLNRWKGRSLLHSSMGMYFSIDLGIWLQSYSLRSLVYLAGKQLEVDDNEKRLQVSPSDII